MGGEFDRYGRVHAQNGSSLTGKKTVYYCAETTWNNFDVFVPIGKLGLRPPLKQSHSREHERCGRHSDGDGSW